MSASLLLGLLIAALGVAVIWIFNRLVRDRNQVAAAWSDIDVQLQKRHDLIPPLVEIVRGYATHERELLERVTAERTQSRNAHKVGSKGEIERALGNDVGRLIALAEAYPDLKASENFAQLNNELVKVEDHLQYARRFYNGSVRQFNDRIQVFPHVLVARGFGFREAEFFDAPDSAASAPQVKL
ncbi:LemA family protein [Dokdonella sp.]|uniref:LemA family protein n=1 Tax=Dokdonella sp. TaxID=2291710 RepID=UPI003528D9B9